jgi:hypothetical protein
VFDVEGSHAAVRYRRMGSRTGCGRRAATGRCGTNNAQFLIEACVEILHRDPDTGTLGPAVPGDDGHVRLAEDSTPLHEALGVPETDIRRSVLRLFQGVDEALLRHAERSTGGWAG